MFTQDIELRGHIIDSLTLPKVLDEILQRAGTFRIREIRVGEQPTDPSYARVEVQAASLDQVDAILRRLRQHGAGCRSRAALGSRCAARGQRGRQLAGHRWCRARGRWSRCPW